VFWVFAPVELSDFWKITKRVCWYLRWHLREQQGFALSKNTFVVLCGQFDKSQLAALSKIREKKGAPVAEAVRRAVYMYLKRN
jgi:hypothetical protein